MASKKEELAAGRRLHYIREPVSFLVARSSCLAGSGSVCIRLQQEYLMLPALLDQVVWPDACLYLAYMGAV